MTSYEDINELLDFFANELSKVFGDKLIGLYLTGSLSYGDFHPESGDIDLLVVLARSVSKVELRSVKWMHGQIGKKYRQWEKRVECSYISRDMLRHILPPKKPRPYFGEGEFHDKAPYGNEWLINMHLLYKHGIALRGPDFKSLTTPPDIKDVQKACIRDLFQEWKPKISKKEYFNNSHYQAYIVLNLCRILYTVVRGETDSKKVSAEWVKNTYAPQWGDLIKAAENWEYGKEMKYKKEAVEFIKFVINEVNKTKIS